MTSLVATGLSIPGRLGRSDLTVEPGALVALIGPNGGGKTSLLRALARVEGAAGEVRIGGENLDALGEARRVRLLAFLPASRDMGWPISARDIIALGLMRRDDARIAELIEQFEMSGFADRPVDRLSTGERTRVLIARALAASPRLLLLDEPLSNLEPYWVLRLIELLRAYADEGGMVLVALHDLNQLAAFDRALLVAGGQIVEDDAPGRVIASARFGEVFRLRGESGGWAIRR